MKLKYTGTADVRRITKGDFKDKEGVTDAETVEWSDDNDRTAEVPPEMGQWLLDHETGFKLVEEPKASDDSPDATRSSQEAGGDLAGSVGQATSSTSTRKRS